MKYVMLIRTLFPATVRTKNCLPVISYMELGAVVAYLILLIPCFFVFCFLNRFGGELLPFRWYPLRSKLLRTEINQHPHLLLFELNSMPR